MSSVAPILIGPELVFFGDSLSDPGNLATAGEGLIDPAATEGLLGPGGQASDGPVWAAYMGPLTGTVTLNYAVAGAEAAGTQTLGAFAVEGGLTDALLVPLDDPALAWDMNLTAQTSRYLADTAGQDRSASTAFLLIGANDYSGIDLTNPLAALAAIAATLDSVLAATIGNVQTLLDAGVGQVIVSSLPSAALFPLFSGLSAAEQTLAQAVFDAHDAGLANAVAVLAAGAAPVFFFDMGHIADAVVDDPGAFGFLAPLALTLTSGDAALAGLDADQVGFWDALHPSTALHGVLASYAAAALSLGAQVLGAGADTLAATDGADLVLAYGGHDALTFGAGDDLGFAGSGDDQLTGGTGHDLLSGGAGNDYLQGSRGQDILDGDDGDDWMGGGRGHDTLISGLGQDTLAGGKGDDLFIFHETALISGTAGGPDSSLILGGGGTDTLWLVLTEQTFALLPDSYEGNPLDPLLDMLGLTLAGIEQVRIVVERDGLHDLIAQSGESTALTTADLWGLL